MLRLKHYHHLWIIYFKNQTILKIDTEGYEYKILKGLNKKHLELILYILNTIISNDYKRL